MNKTYIYIYIYIIILEIQILLFYFKEILFNISKINIKNIDTNISFILPFN
jgi:hypothetical protein